MAEVEIGDVLAGKYRVTKVLGIGGMGVVVAATHIQLDEPVALKFMLPDALKSQEAVSRFLREARAAVKLRSEHVARVSDVGTLETGAPYIVMEYLEGTDLSGALAARGPMPPEMAVEYTIQACDALAEAHAMGIVHRDLKPANLFLTHRKDSTPLVKVLDFGISKSTALNEQGAGSLTKTGGIMGSPLYMSPEQMKSAKDTDARTDIWALGVILYELLGGRTPFDSDTIGGLMAQVLTEPPAPLASVRGGLPPGLSEVIGRCLEKDRNQRWPTVAHLTQALAPFAPSRVQPLVERISIVLGQGGQRASLPDARSALSPTQALGATGAVMTGASAAVQTSPGWGNTAGPTKPSIAPVFAAMAIGLVVVGGGGLFAFRHFGAPATATASASPPETSASSAASAASPPPSTATAAPPPTATAAPPTTSAPEAVPVAAVETKPAPTPGKKSRGATSSPGAPQVAAQPTAAPPTAKSAAKPPAGGLFDTSN